MRNLILAIEDNDDDILVMKRGFKKGKIGNPVMYFHNGQEAIDFIEENKTDKLELILLDLNMEVMNGFDFLRIRQQSERLRKVPVVVLTSSCREEDIELAYSLGANAYVEKPINPKDFIKSILTIEEFWVYLAKKPNSN